MQRLRSRLPRRRAGDATEDVRELDPITGLPVRAVFRQRAEQSWVRAAENHRLISVIMFSIDRFRECGGTAAANFQRAVAEVIKAHCHRRADFIGRLRDHEFAVLLSGATRQGTRQVAETIRKAVEARDVRSRLENPPLTVSAGIAAMLPRPTRFVDALLIAADEGLREARRLGGNKVRTSSTLR